MRRYHQKFHVLRKKDTKSVEKKSLGERNVKILDSYVVKAPCDQNILDIFNGEWSSAMPEGSRLITKPGNANLFEDLRINWIEENMGPVQDLNILELGPLECGHSYLLHQKNAKRIIAIEANTRAYLKCLCVKEIFGLNNLELKLGDFVSYLEETHMEIKYDLVVASGVLYHMMDPPKLLDLISRVTDRVFLWTHYYDAAIIKSNENISFKFNPLEQIEYDGVIYESSLQDYEKALDWSGFCGGSTSQSRWLTRQSIIKCLKHYGFTDITIGFDHHNHALGPAFAIYAQRESRIY
ncbi:class I SAM-dependent methyltransferase [bacterium]|nr:class I SAM-dependent methyltransferase [bacterium]